jgi:hypothetical protein
MKFKAVLIGALVKPPSFGKQTSAPVPWMRFATSKEEAEQLGRGVLDGLPPEDRKGALVRLIEIREVVVGELR